MLMSTQHMVSSNDYGCTPVGGRVCKETDLVVMKAIIQAGSEPHCSQNRRKSYVLLFTFTDIYHVRLR